MLAVGWCILEVRCLWYPDTSWLFVMLCSTFLSFLPLPHSCPELKNVEWVCEREWIEIGILNIHFGQFSTSLFSSLHVSHFLSTPMFAVGWCILEVVMFVVSRYVIAVRDIVFNVFKLSVLPQSCCELTNVEWVCVKRVD